MTVRDARIPAAIQDRLVEALRRFRRVVLVKALTVTVAVFLAAMLSAIALDRLFIMSFALRAILSLTAAALTLLAAYVWGVRSWMRRPGSVDLAATVEAEHPELQERVSSTIEFATQTERPEYRGSEEMVQAVSEQAIASSVSVDFAEVISAERARKSAVAAAFLVIVTAGLAMIWWGDFKVLFSRFAMPWANIARVSATHIEVGEPGDKVVARGESVQITAAVAPSSVSEATLNIEVQPGRWAPIRMTQVEAGSFSHRLADVTGSMRYTVRAGDGETRAYNITVVERPSVTRTALRYEYPAYTKRPAKDEPNSPGDVRAVVGTKVTITVTVSKSVTKAQLEMTGLSRPAAMQSAGANRYSATFDLTTSGQYVARLEDSFGFTNHDEEVRQVIADADAIPVIRVTQPDRNIKLHAAATVGVAMEAKDDFGVAELAIVYTVNEGEEKTQSVPMPSPGSATAQPGSALATPGECDVALTYPWELAKMGLKPGDLISYRAKAVDTRPGPRPGVGFSETRTILITSPRYEVDENIREKMLQEAKKQMQQLKAELEKARNAERQMKELADANRPIAENQDKKKTAAEERLKAAEPMAEKLTELLKKDPLLEPLAPKSEEIEKKNIPEAKEAVARVDEMKPLQASKSDIDKAEKETTEAIKKLDEMLEEVKELEKQEEKERKLADMADKEQKLADQADKVQPDQKDPAEDLAKQQDQLKEQLEQMMNDEMKQDALEQALEEMKDIRQDLRDLINQEKDLKKETEDAKKKKLEELTKRQEDLNKEAAEAKREVQPKLDERQAGPVPEEPMKKALDAMKEDRIADAVNEQKKAEDKMNEQADKLEKPAAQAENQPEKPAAPEQAKKMEQLAGKQEQIRKELAQLAGMEQKEAPKDEKMEQLADQQQAIEEQAQDLAEKMEELAGALEQAAPEMGEQAKKAEGKMKEAPKHMDNAEKKLDAAQPEPAAADEQKAIDAMEQADAEAGKLEQALADAAKPENGPPENGPPEAGLEMAKALSQMKDASQEMRGNKPEQGSKSMEQAASHLAQAAAKMMKKGKPEMATRQPKDSKDPKGIKGVPVRPVDLADLKGLRLTPEEWNRLPGEIKQQLLQAMKGNYPEEYRQLIRDYFSSIAKTKSE